MIINLPNNGNFTEYLINILSQNEIKIKKNLLNKIRFCLYSYLYKNNYLSTLLK